MMQKNETALLEPWLRYHSYLFGFENLYVFDNGSTLPEVRTTLDRFESVGVNVDYSKSGPRNFDGKGIVVGNLIKEFQNSGKYDIVLPLDCDEFVAISNRFGFSCGRREILAEIDRLAAQPCIARVARCLDNRPGFLNLFRLTDFRKSIVPVSDFLKVDHGFHEAKTNNHPDMCPTNILYVHMHFRPFSSTQQSARDKLEPFVNVDDIEALKNFQGVGKHLPRYFFMTEEEYYSDFGDYRFSVVQFNGFQNLLSVLMPMEHFMEEWCWRPSTVNVVDNHILGRLVVNMDGIFDADLYLQAQPDVAKSGMDPVVHYCLFGAREGRALRPPAERGAPGEQGRQGQS
jgi:hypothetical protein